METDPWEGAGTMTGAHVRLEPLRRDHAADLLVAADSDDVFEHLTVSRPRSAREAEDLVGALLGRDDLQPWAQVEVGSGRAVGVTTYYEVDRTQRTVAIGHTWLARRVWRTPVNTEAKLLLLTRAFDQMGCVRVVWHTDVRNLRSQAAIERLGAVREGLLRKHRRRLDGSWRDTVVYAMTDDEWPGVRRSLEARLA
ncbi:acetyltransferase, GNAT family [Aeromicrobium marinum DSM 15272]|uniref:Acetyltransferase, GNAT family n=1 Tax=Aeromicrobium marinum DSM 15272 TaxID=585531 RepID=E2SDC4_9ACTN|nr:GNAT family protein [Aeromicrobium marinum]EFQ82501.1 acetyltransferase, GNAT family [Aeromicrobium marinum DSM 15272]